MYETPNKVLAAARELGLGTEAFGQAGPARWEDILKRVFERFATTHDTGVTWLWSHLRGQGVSVRTVGGVALLGEMRPREERVWLLVEDFDRTKEDGNYWVFEGAFGAVIEVLMNLHAIEYYIVDRHMDWMIVENHHNVLIGVGECAESFLKKLGTSLDGTTTPC
jgi:hypothetical protein